MNTLIVTDDIKIFINNKFERKNKKNEPFFLK